VLRGLTSSAVPAAAGANPSNQKLEATTYHKPTLNNTKKKSERVRISNKNLHSSFGSSFNYNASVPASFLLILKTSKKLSHLLITTSQKPNKNR
ncbi:hypothetical protein, partial [Priestia megaterium]|uniref:hypothetical protein n=1 Tax=Priestia megaterium TaxID=1404 RepID=UPI00237AE648